MLRHRDRHNRGIRGPLAPVTSAAGQALRRQRPAGSAEFFVTCVTDALGRVSAACPEALEGVDVGLEDVPDTSGLWGTRVPLAAAQEATPDAHARIVVYRRPIEHRASSRAQLRRLVYRTIVEQLSALTGLTLDRIDPSGDASAEDDE